MYLLEIEEISPLVPFSKNMYISGSGISLIFAILNIASQLKPGALN